MTQMDFDQLAKAKAYIIWFETNRYKTEKTSPPYSMTLKQALEIVQTHTAGECYLI